MGHAEHFLTRIERLNARQADVALALYRDSALVRYILARVDLPEGAERVALALEHTNSPHVIVTRTGAFVTCLAAGMTVHGAALVSRAELDRLDEKFEFVRVGLRQAERVQESRQLMHRMLGGGSTLSREDFAALRSLMPIFGDAMLRVASDIAKSTSKLQDAYRSSHYRQGGPRVTARLHHHWYRVWSLGHAIALAGSYSEDLPVTPPELRTRYIGALSPLLWLAISTMVPHVVARAAWAASRVGRVLVPFFRDVVDESQTFGTLTGALVPLVAVGLRDPEVRGEVHEIVAQSLRRFVRMDPQLTGVDREICQWMLSYCGLMLVENRDDSYVEALRGRGATLMALRGASLPAGHPQRWERPDDVPVELSLSAVGYLEPTLLAGGPQRELAFLALPWLARASADDLYVPDQYIEAYGNTFQAEVTLHALEEHAQYHRIGEPARAKAKPGRNEPCSCGSGKKYKRCCGAAA
jgi:hypothetical protein